MGEWEVRPWCAVVVRVKLALSARAWPGLAAMLNDSSIERYHWLYGKSAIFRALQDHHYTRRHNSNNFWLSVFIGRHCDSPYHNIDIKNFRNLRAIVVKPCLIVVCTYPVLEDEPNSNRIDKAHHFITECHSKWTYYIYNYNYMVYWKSG